MSNLIEGISLDVVYSKASGNIWQTVDKKAHSPLKVPDLKGNINSQIVQWGVDNLFPQRVLKEIRKNSIIGPTLKKQAEIAYDEIVYGFEEVDESGNAKFRRVIDPKVEAFFFRSHIHRYYLEALRNF